MLAPTHVRLLSSKVLIHDGSRHAVRAVDFISLPQASSNETLDDHRDVAMRAIDAGAIDEGGVRVPLSPSSGGKNKKRDPVEYIARALMTEHRIGHETHAKTAARELLKDLLGIGCVIVDKDFRLPCYEAGRPNGTRPGRGLVTCWDTAPWGQRAGSSPEAAPEKSARQPDTTHEPSAGDASAEGLAPDAETGASPPGVSSVMDCHDADATADDV
jgi:hypothetical protein